MGANYVAVDLVVAITDDVCSFICHRVADDRLN
jgi:hypothetical protein